MPGTNIEANFSFASKDFQSCTGYEEDARYLHSRFKTLFKAIEENEIFKQAFSNFSGYVARPWNQGSKEYRDYIWLGIANEIYEKPREEVQFQVSIFQDALWIDLFIDQAARDARNKVKLQIEKNKDEFLNILRDLTNYSIGYSGANNSKVKCNKINDVDFRQILQNIGERHIHFFIRRELPTRKAVVFNGKIVSEILYTWLQLRPLYELVEPKISNDLKIPATPISDKRHITQHIKRQFPSKEIDLNETEAEAAERESKKITYETNWEAQEKANSSHKNAVMLLANYLNEHGVTPMYHVIDTFAEKNRRIFIFEVKSIHIGNFIHQTRTAIGQLLYYVIDVNYFCR